LNLTKSFQQAPKGREKKGGEKRKWVVVGIFCSFLFWVLHKGEEVERRKKKGKEKKKRDLLTSTFFCDRPVQGKEGNERKGGKEKKKKKSAEFPSTLHSRVC